MTTNLIIPKTQNEFDTILNNGLPTIPTNPMQLKPFITIGTKAAQAMWILLRQPNFSPERYNDTLKFVQQYAMILLYTERRLADILNGIPTHRGQRNDLNARAYNANKTKKDIIAAYGLKTTQAKDIAKLTDESIQSAYEFAINNGRIPTHSLAVGFVQKNTHIENNAPLSSWEHNCIYVEQTRKSATIKKKIQSINYTVLFANAGIGEYYLKQNGFHGAVASELLPERVKWYKEIYADSEVVCGSIVDKLDELVKLHHEKNCKVVLASPPCQDFSNAGKRKFNTNKKRSYLFLTTLEFIKQVNDINEYVLIENVPEFISAKPKTLKGQTIGEYITRFLESLGYEVNIDIQSAADYGTCQDRKRAIILASKKGLWKFPTKDKQRPMLFESIGNLPRLEAGQSSRRNNINLKWHYAPAINWNQRAVLMHTPSGRSARDNITKWQPVNVDGIPCNAKHGGIFGRNDWGKPCHTVLMSSNTISGDWTIHPGRPLSGGTYSDARYFTILELLRITGLPDSYEIPTWASDKLIRDVIGECFVPRHVERLMTTLPR